MRQAGLSAPKTFGAIAVLVLLAIAPGAAFAQQNNSSDNSYTDISAFLWSGNQSVPQQALTGAPPQSSSAVQIGQMNSATATLAGSGNITTQYQAGSQNTSNLSANGMQNTLTTTQIGNSNTSNVSVNGNNNNISNLQVGSGLTYQLQVIGTNAPVSVQQYGRR
jgi:hypothetical protein